jgi:hypothetical protein
LRHGQGGVYQRVGPEGMVEDIGGARQQEPQALARKVVAEVRSLWRSHLSALISFSQLPRA